MEHLTTETLASLVDGAPEPDEGRHLESCEACREELAALRRQTEELKSLPELLPPPGDWDVLEARMRSDGLVRDPALLARLTLARTPTWMRAAAAVVLFLGGAGLGATFTSRGAFDSAQGSAGMLNPTLFAEAVGLEDAASAVRIAEQNYVTALTRYRQLLAQRGDDGMGVDPRSRYAVLEYLVAASQAAVRQAPADPFLNGLLASTLAEREAALHRISNNRDNWF